MKFKWYYLFLYPWVWFNIKIRHRVYNEFYGWIPKEDDNFRETGPYDSHILNWLAMSDEEQHKCWENHRKHLKAEREARLEKK